MDNDTKFSKKAWLIGAGVVFVSGTVITAIILMAVWCSSLAEQARTVREEQELFAQSTDKKFVLQAASNKDVVDALQNEIEHRKLSEKNLQVQLHLTSKDLRTSLQQLEEDLDVAYDVIDLYGKAVDAHTKAITRVTAELEIAKQENKNLLALLDREKEAREKEKKTIAMERQKELDELKEELRLGREELKKALADPWIGKNLSPVLSLQSHYGEAIFSSFIFFPKAREKPEEELLERIKHLQEAALGDFFAEKFRPLLFAYLDDGDVAITEKQKKLSAEVWRVGFAKMKPRTFMEQVLEPNPKPLAVLVNTQVFPNGARLIWSRTPSEDQLKRVAPRLEALAQAMGLETGKGHWHGSRTYVFNP